MSENTAQRKADKKVADKKGQTDPSESFVQHGRAARTCCSLLPSTDLRISSSRTRTFASG